MAEETIIAISTPIGYGGLGIVRLSGDKSFSIAKKIFRPKKPKAKIQPRRPLLGNLYTFEQKEFFEEAYLTYFPPPQTYTREEMVEISCHGSPVVLEEVVRLGIKAGARHAHPGEFTLRAYLNGRIDILQAEAVNDLIQASSLFQAKISFSQLRGSLSQKIDSLKKNIIHLLSQIEASIEFPEEGLRISGRQIAKTTEMTIRNIKNLIRSYNLGKTLREGLHLAITGRANVGKSTLFNSLLEKERAIVTPYPGTTRDFLQEKISIKDSLFTLTDMAGLSAPSHPVEKEGIKKGEKLLSQADGVLLMFDSSQRETPDDLRLITKYKHKNLFLVFNKMDLPTRIDKEKITNQGKNFPGLDISALKGTNLERLKQMIHETFVPTRDQGEEILLHLRQKLLLEETLASLSEGRRLLEEGYSEEIYAQEIRKAISTLGQLTGEIRVDEIMENIFDNFCVGK
ncbi:MAG: tRNA uridine-5-carboxymethylaminomethyl(34) synthesis GTPase MnmE [Candidatus Aminicenantes bacterium]